MSSYQKNAEADDVKPLSNIDTAPPLCPAPMPRQTLVYWTPRLVLSILLRSMTVLWRGAHQVPIFLQDDEEPR